MFRQSSRRALSKSVPPIWCFTDKPTQITIKLLLRDRLWWYPQTSSEAIAICSGPAGPFALGSEMSQTSCCETGCRHISQRQLQTWLKPCTARDMPPARPCSCKLVALGGLCRPKASSMLHSKLHLASHVYIPTCATYILCATFCCVAFFSTEVTFQLTSMSASDSTIIPSFLYPF